MPGRMLGSHEGYARMTSHGESGPAVSALGASSPTPAQPASTFRWILAK